MSRTSASPRLRRPAAATVATALLATGLVAGGATGSSAEPAVPPASPTLRAAGLSAAGTARPEARPEALPEVVVVRRTAKGGLAVERREASSVSAAAGMARSLSDDSGVIAASPNYTRRAFGITDTYRYLQWPLASTATYTGALGGVGSWASSTGTSVKVAVVDSGVDATHPDLRANVLPGVDLVKSSLDGRTDPLGHGTHVAGIIAARADDSFGVAGLAPQAKILPVRVLNAYGSGSDADVIEGITWATDHGAQVINLSLGSEEQSAALEAATTYAIDHGVVVVAAAGNSHADCVSGDDYGCGNPVMYPAANPGVIGVAAVKKNGVRAGFSETGSFVDIAAPGVDVLSTWPDGWAYADGTSMATPYVAAAAAQLKSVDSTLTPAEVEQYLTGTAQDAGKAGHDTSYGAGLLRPIRAMKALVADGITKKGTALALESTPSGSVVTGTKATVVGRLSPRYAHKKVALQRYDAASGTWKTMASAYSDMVGKITVPAEITTNTRVRLSYAGGSTYTGSTSPSALVRARAIVRATGKNLGSGKVTVAVTVVPKQKTKTRLQIKRSSGWVTLRTRTTTSAGKVTFSKVTVGAGARKLRVVSSRTTVSYGATSPVLKITVS